MSLLPLQKNSVIGVVAPASYPEDREKVRRSIANLEKLGYSVKTEVDKYQPMGYLAEGDEVRAADLNRMISDPEISHVFCLRGGYGSQRLLGLVDFASAGKSRKVLIGYSDITVLQLALHRKAGWASISGSMPAVEWADNDPRSTDPELWNLIDSGSWDSLDLGGNSLPDNTGEAEGVILGGNLSCIVRMIGTPYLPDLSGAILFVEDVGEPPYRVDAMFSQLVDSGIFADLAGLIIGQFTDDADRPGKPTLSISEVIAHYTRSLNIPIVIDANYGHIHPKIPLPIGVNVRLAVTNSGATLQPRKSPTKSPSGPKRKRVAVMASGGGSNFEALATAAQDSYEVALCVTNKPNAGVRDRGRSLNIPSMVIGRADATSDADQAAFLLQIFDKFDIDMIALAGYLKLIPSEVVSAYQNRIVNIHPALLPSFGGKGMYGKRVHEAVISAGCKISGATVHLVDEHYDTGPIVAQRGVAVEPNDDADKLAARVLKVEHQLYPESLARLTSTTYHVRDNRIIFET